MSRQKRIPKLTGQELRQRQFVRRENGRMILLFLTRILILALFFSTWEWASQSGAINAFIFSSPSRVWNTLCEWTKQGMLIQHAAVTMRETMVSFLIVSAAGIAAAILLWRFPFLYQVLEPYLILLNSLPKSALAPLLIVWLGNKPRTIILVAVSLAVFSSILTLYNAFAQTDSDKIKLIRSLNGNRFHVVQKILIPAGIPVFISNMKVNIGLCLVGVIIGEFLAAREGLGYLIIYSSQVFKMDWVVTAILILCLIAAVLYLLISAAEISYRRYCLRRK